MSLSRDSLAVRQMKLILRSEFTLDQRLKRLEWEEKVLYPKIEQMKAGAPVMGLAEGKIFEIVVINDAHSDPNQTAAAGASDSSQAVPDSSQKPPDPGA